MKKIKYLLITLLLIISNLSQGQVWDKFSDSLFNNQAGTPVIYCFFKIHDTLYVGGGFHTIGNAAIKDIAFWDGNKWNTLNYSIYGGYITDINKYQNNIYLCGFMSDYGLNLNGITFWDGITWNSLDTIFPSPASVCNTIEVFDNNLFIGGNFGKIVNQNDEGEEYRRIAAWDGIHWLHVGNFDNMNVHVSSLVTYNNELYAGGSFNNSFGPDTIQTLLVAKYQGGQQWTNVGTGLWDGAVVSLVVDTINNFLYAGGGFYIPNDTQNGCCIARWDGFEWNGIGGGLNMDLNGSSKMGFYHGDLYVSGWFTQAGNTPVNHIARWNGVQWDSVPGIEGSHVTTFIEYNDWLVVGGNFTSVGGIQTKAIAKFFLPVDSTCPSFTPLVQTFTDTAYLNNQGQAEVQFYNNNAYSPYWHWDFGDGGTDIIRNPLHTFTDTGTFHVCVTTSNNMCEKTACRDIVILLQTSIINNEQLLSKADLKIYPNPASNSIFIETILQQNEIGQLKISDSKGKFQTIFNVKSGKNSVKVNTSLWAKGTYFCSLILNGKFAKAEKLIIK